MPHRRKPQKGSFGGHFDELVGHFPHHPPSNPNGDEKDRPKEERSVHDRLFEGAWHRSTPT